MMNSPEKIIQLAEKVWSANSKQGKDLDKKSFIEGFCQCNNLLRTFTCYQCNYTTDNPIFVMISGKDNKPEQVPICQKCYQNLLK